MALSPSFCIAKWVIQRPVGISRSPSPKKWGTRPRLRGRGGDLLFQPISLSRWLISVDYIYPPIPSKSIACLLSLLSISQCAIRSHSRRSKSKGNCGLALRAWRGELWLGVVAGIIMLFIVLSSESEWWLGYVYLYLDGQGIDWHN